MANHAAVVRTQLLPLDGKSFSNKDELDDAFFPYFGPLQAMFPGDGHRDLVDRLIALKWISMNSSTGEYTVKLPADPDAAA